MKIPMPEIDDVFEIDGEKMKVVGFDTNPILRQQFPNHARLRLEKSGGEVITALVRVPGVTTEPSIAPNSMWSGAKA